MRLGLSQVLRAEQRLVQSPQMIQAMQVLQYPLLELRDRVEKEMNAPIPTGTQVARSGGSGGKPTEIFHGADWDQISRTQAPVAAPPQPGS